MNLLKWSSLTSPQLTLESCLLSRFGKATYLCVCICFLKEKGVSELVADFDLCVFHCLKKDESFLFLSTTFCRFFSHLSSYCPCRFEPLKPLRVDTFFYRDFWFQNLGGAVTWRISPFFRTKTSPRYADMHRWGSGALFSFFMLLWTWFFLLQEQGSPNSQARTSCVRGAAGFFIAVVCWLYWRVKHLLALKALSPGSFF